MAAPIKPQKVTANGKDSWWFLPAIASLKMPTIAEINAVSGLNITCFLTAEQEGFTQNVERAQLTRLLCELATQEALGATTYALPDLTVVFNPQGAPNSDGKKAWEAMKDGGPGFLVRRQGVVSLSAKDVEVGQFVDTAQIELGKPLPGKTATDASGIYSFTSPVGLLDQEFNVPVVAAA